MASIPVVENPRRRRRRTLTAAQRRAGFGGRAAMGGSRRRRRRRRNPALATLTANPRRRRRRYAPTRRRYYRRRRNPSLGGIGRMLNLKTAIGVAGGILTAAMAPALVRRVWAAAPTTGFGGSAVRIGASLAVATGVRYVFKDRSLAAGMIAGAVGFELYSLADQYLLPYFGLGSYESDRMVTRGELEAIGIAGYVPAADGLNGYDVTDEVLAA